MDDGRSALPAGTLDLLILPALQRMQVKGWIASESKKTPTGRQARYYRITAAGRRQLGAEETSFQRSVAATTRVLRGAES